MYRKGAIFKRFCGIQGEKRRSPYRVGSEEAYHTGWLAKTPSHHVMCCKEGTDRDHAFLTRNTHIWMGVEEGVYYCTHTTNSAFSAAEI